MLASEPRRVGRSRHPGPNPGVYVILFYCLGFCAALAVQTMAHVKPLVIQWWWAILAGEIVVYALTLFIPPLGRFHAGRALTRVISGVALRFLIAFTCGLFQLIGGEKADLVKTTGLFWAAHWPSAASSIAVVALATYVLRVMAVRRAALAGPAPSQAPARRMTRDELLQELMSGEPAAEATQPLLAGRPTVSTTVAEPQQSLPLTEPPPAVIAEPAARPLQPIVSPGEAEAVGPPLVALREPIIARLVPEPVAPPEMTEEAEAPPEVPVPTPIVAAPLEFERAEVAPLPVVAPKETPAAPEPEMPPTALLPPWPAPAPAVVEPVATAPEAPPAEAVPPAGEEVPVGSAVRLPAEAILRGLPPALLALPIEEAVARVPDGIFSFPWDDIAPQLAEGEVRVSAHDLLRQFPPGIIAGTPGQFMAALSRDGVALPLAEIVSRVPPRFFAPPEDQAEIGTSPDGPVIFQEATPTGVAPAAARWTPPVAPAPSPPPLEPVATVPDSPSVGAPSVSPPEPPPVPEVVAPPLSIEEEAVAEVEEPPTEPAPAPFTPALPPWPQPALEAEEAEAPVVGTVTGDLALPIVEPEAAFSVEPVGAPVFAPAVAQLPAEEPAPPPEPTRVVEPAPEEVVSPSVVEPAAIPAEELAVPTAAPTGAEVPAGLAVGLLTELRSLDCRNVDVASRPGLTVAVAHTFLSPNPDLAEGFAELVARSRELTRQGGAGDLATTLVIGTQGAAFVGAADCRTGVYLGVETDRAGAGQAAVAARKALPLLGSVPAATAPATAGPSPVLERPAADPSLAGLAARAITGSKTAAFRSRDGLGLALVGVTPEESGDLAAAALAVWTAAQRAHPSGVDKVLVLGSDRTLGIAFAQRAGTLAVAGFPHGVSTGLVGIEIGRLAKACDEAAATGGIAGDAV